MVSEANRRVATESLRDHNGEARLRNTDDRQLLLDMFPPNSVHTLHHSGGYRSRHQDQNDRSGQFHSDGRGETVHPHCPQREHQRLHSARARGLDASRGGPRERSTGHDRQRQVRPVALSGQRDLHVLRRHLLHHANADHCEANGDHRQRDREIAVLSDLPRHPRSKNHAVLRDRSVHAGSRRLRHLHAHHRRLQPGRGIRHARLRPVPDTHAEDGRSRGR